jgi:hypothetical protein
MRQRYIKSIKSKIYDYVVANYRKIDPDNFVLGDIPYNYKCHLNPIQKVKEGKADRIYSCICINKNNWQEIVIHFINQLNDGKFQDNTWGWLYQDYSYYIVREIDKSEHNNISNIFDGLRATLVKNNSNSFLRKVLRIKTDII